MERIDQDPQPKNPQKNFHLLAFGIIVIALGFFWLMRNVGLLSESTWHVIFSWEMLLIAIGVISLFNPGGRLFGILLIVVGGFFLLSDFVDLPFTFRKVFWPALLILAGLYLILGHKRMFRSRAESETSEGFIDEVSIFSSVDKKIQTDSFKGGRMVSIFGGSKIDLTQSKLGENADMEITFIFGGSNLVVPPDWNVQMKVSNIFGGFSDKRPKVESYTSNTLVIRGLALFGGGEISSF
jgi:predicted membrane protein